MIKKKKFSRGRCFMFTINNPTMDDKNLLRGYLKKLPDKIRFIVFQTESGKEDGTPHIQGYCELKTRAKIGTATKLVGGRAHVERRYASQAQAIAYCTKKDTRVNGIAGENGIKARSKKDSIQELVKNMDKMDVDELRDEFPTTFLMNKNKILTNILDKKGVRNWQPEIEIYVGDTGTGKSYTAHKLHPNAYVTTWPTGGRWWWPNYYGQETVIMDEFRHQIKYDTMLQLMDRYDFTIEYKGGNSNFVSKKIVITTNIDPKNWYPGLDKETKEPLRRRIEEYAKIYDFKKGQKFPNFLRKKRKTKFKFETKELDFSVKGPKSHWDYSNQ